MPSNDNVSDKLMGLFSDTNTLRPNGVGYKQGFYQRFELYVFLTNRIRGNQHIYKEKGWIGDNADTRDFVKILSGHPERVRELLNEYGAKDEFGIDLDAIGDKMKSNGKYEHTYFELFMNEIESYEQLATEVRGVFNSTSPVLEQDQLKQLILARQQFIEKKREVVRKSVEDDKFTPKAGDEKYYGGSAVVLAQRMEDVYYEKRRVLNATRRREAGYGLATIGFGGATIASIASLVIAPGIVPVLSIAACFPITKKLFDKFREKRAKRRALKEDLKDFLYERGEYVTGSDGKIKSYNLSMRNLRSLKLKWKIYSTVKKNMESKSLADFEKWFWKFRSEKPKQFKKLSEAEFLEICDDARLIELERPNANFSKGNAGMTARILRMFSAKTPTAEMNLQLTNVPDIEPDLENRLKNHSNIGDIQGDILQLKRYEEYFNNAHAQEKYEAWQGRFSNKVNEALVNNLFENTFTTQTISDVVDGVNDPVLSEALEKWGIGDKKSSVNEVIKIFTNEHGQPEEPLKYNVNLSAENQFSFGLSGTAGRNKFVDICKSYGADATEVAEIESQVAPIASALANAKTKQEAEAVDLGAVTNANALNYLNELKKNKMSTLVNGASALSGIRDGEVENLIANLRIVQQNSQKEAFVSGTTQLEEIRKKISKMTDPNQRDLATKLLNEQISSLERGKRAEIRADLVDCLKNMQFRGDISISDIFNNLQNIQFENVNEQNNKDLYDKTIMRNVTPTSMKNYLAEQYKLRLEKVFKTQAERSEVKNSLDKIIEFLKQLANCAYLSNAQRERLTKIIEPNIKIALDNEMKSITDFFEAKDFDATKYSKLLKNEINQGGLADILDDSTLERKQISQKLDYLSRADDIRGFFDIRINGSVFKLPQIEASKVTEILMDPKRERELSDDLFKVLNIIKATDKKKDSGNELIESGAQEAYVQGITGDKGIAGDKGVFGKIDALSSNDDKYVALIALKKSIMSTYVDCSEKYLTSKTSYANISSYLTNPANRKDFVDNVYNKWVNTPPSGKNYNLISLIEEKLKNLNTDNQYAYESAIDAAKKAFSRENANNFINGRVYE